MAMHLPITEAIYAGRVISRVPPDQVPEGIADLANADAIHVGVTAEISTSPDYPLCQEWAQACWNAGFGALRCSPRFTPGGGDGALAIFDDAGEQPARGTSGRRSLLDVLGELNYPVVRRDELTSDALDINDDVEPG